MEKITYKKSFASKLVLEQVAIPYYQDIKDLCATRKKVSTRLSFNKETINVGRNKVAVMKISRKNITLYLALNKAELDQKYNVKDLTDTKEGETYGVSIQIKGSRTLKHALELLELALTKFGATQIVEGLSVDYSEVYKYRNLEALVSEGLVKKYVKVLVDGKEQLVEMPVVETYNVNFTAKLLYEATDAAEELYIITSHSNWDLKQAVKMKKHADGTFTASMSFPKNTLLEFKICRSQNWTDVEKGIWKEEIVNHNYVVVDKDLEVEDLIYNFRRD
jgi:hypothetical protein